MYAAAYAVVVCRTNIYLSDTGQAGLDARAAAEGSTRSDVIRSIVDRELNLADEADLDLLFGPLATERARNLSDADPISGPSE